MTDDFDIVEYLKGQLRQDPNNQHLKQLIRSTRRRQEAFGDRARPPSSTFQAAQTRLLADELVPSSQPQMPNGRLPIDLEVGQLIDDGHIRIITPEQQAAGEEGMTHSDALWGGRQSVVDGCRWADYYARYKLGTEPSAKAAAKIALADAKSISAMLADFIAAHAIDLSAGRYTAPGARATAAQNNLSLEVDTLRNAHDALLRIVDRLTPEAIDTGGRPGDPWRVGFVFGISQGWTMLTRLKISAKDSARFVGFVASGAASLSDGLKDNSDAWTSAIKTAAKAFELAEDGLTWVRRPGP
ncbi:hypothetical protein MKK65_13955 [Methylobacterium sp. J-001]|uniref:hypothetical protein n=1 Tax=Methylobacterium sp. J-001 TaxID=2836609 RepID=UPI001FBA995F|nr:hypothetical protein [Methylobacterium sp. J-001]MCJ2117656.1 hypothetical protein [Methylobacterium sp. J-001]